MIKFSEVVQKYSTILHSFDEEGFPQILEETSNCTDFSTFDSFHKDFEAQYQFVIEVDQLQEAFGSIQMGKVKYIDERRNYFLIWFSDYGNLVTIKGDLKDYSIRFNSYDMYLLFKTHGFTYIPYEILRLPYDGLHTKRFDEIHPRQHHTWFDRYFNYI